MEKSKKSKSLLLAAGFAAVYLAIFALLFGLLYRMLSTAQTAQTRAVEISFLQLRIYLDSALEDARERAEEPFSDEDFLALLAESSGSSPSSYEALFPYLSEMCDSPLTETVCLLNLTDREAVDADQRFYLNAPESPALRELFSLADETLPALLAGGGEGFFLVGEKSPQLLCASGVSRVGEKDFRVLVKISMEELRRLCDQSISPEASFCLFLPGQEPYFSSSGMELPQEWRTLPEQDAVPIGGSRVTLRSSSLTGVSYLLSVSQASGKAFWLFWICLGCFVPLSAALLAAVFRMARTAGRQALPAAGAEVPHAAEERLLVPTRSDRAYTRSWYLKKVLLREVQFSDGEEYQKYGLSFEQACVLLISRAKGESGQETDELDGLIRESFRALSSVYMLPMDCGTVAVVLSEHASEQFLQQVREGAERLADLLHKRGQTHAVYLSGVHTQFPELPEAYQECLYTSEYCYLHSDEKLVVAHEEVSRQACSFLTMPRVDDIRERFMSFMTRGEFYAAKKELLSLLHSLREIPGLDNRMAKTSIYDCIDIFLRGISLLDQAMVESLFDKFEMIARVMQMDTFADLEEQIESVMNLLILHCDTRSMPMGDKADAAASYLQVHYKDPSLSLEKLADQFSLSAQHLSSEFKSRMGAGVQEYLCGIRIEHAKRLLLQNPSLTVAQVGEAVGFASSQTFIRSFKRQESITPGQYRRQELGGSAGEP